MQVMHASIWMPFPPPIWQCIGLQFEHREFMSKPKKWTEKAAAAALQERINAEQGLPAL